MTKADVVSQVAKNSGLTKQDAEVIVQTVLDSIIGAMKSGDKVQLRGFGSFRLRKKNPRPGRNPKTGEKVSLPAKRVPHFKPGKLLIEMINSQKRS